MLVLSLRQNSKIKSMRTLTLSETNKKMKTNIAKLIN